MIGGQYVLDGHEPKPCDDIREWGRFMQSAERIVAKTDVNHIRVSTVFLGLDHAFMGGDPLLFETFEVG